MVTSPTVKQLEVLRFIHERSVAGPVPTLREIGLEFSISSLNAIADYVEALARKGCLEKGTPHSARSLRVTETGKKFLGVRLCRACGSEVLQ